MAALQKNFTLEPAIDRLLIRKLQRRAGAGYNPPTLEQLSQGVNALIAARTGKHYAISNPRWLTGGASKIQMAFSLDWDRPGVGREITPMVLRMEPAESIVETSRLREFQIIKAVEGLVPVPPVFWCDEMGEFLPYPALIYGFAEGVTKPANSTSGVSGAGTTLSDAIRQKLTPQFIDCLAKIHNFDFATADLSAFAKPATGVQCAEWGVDWWERVWEEDGDEEIPLLRLAAAWLRRNMPLLDRPSLVHSDYRLGNFLFTEHDCNITALLDWELGRIGDRHQDLAWTTSKAFATLGSDGKTSLVCSMLPEAEFFAAYEQASGFAINPKTLHWYKVYNNFSLAILIVGSGTRVAKNAKTHQDVLLAWLSGMGYMILDQMRAQIEQGA
jgi:aminoglycoside phosphotransferase (APT) family kinase protein